MFIFHFCTLFLKVDSINFKLCLWQPLILNAFILNAMKCILNLKIMICMSMKILIYWFINKFSYFKSDIKLYLHCPKPSFSSTFKLEFIFTPTIIYTFFRSKRQEKRPEGNLKLQSIIPKWHFSNFQHVHKMKEHFQEAVPWHQIMFRINHDSVECHFKQLFLKINRIGFKWK